MADLILKICFQAIQTLNDKDKLKLSAVDVVGDREDFMLPDFLRPCDAFDAVPLPLSLSALLCSAYLNFLSRYSGWPHLPATGSIQAERLKCTNTFFTGITGSGRGDQDLDPESRVEYGSRVIFEGQN